MIPRRLSREILLFTLAFFAGFLFEHTRNKSSTTPSVIHHLQPHGQAQIHPVVTNTIISDINSVIPIPLPTTTGTTTNTAQNGTGNIGSRANAAFVVLLQNKDLHDMRKTMRNLESVFNHKHGYPYIFLNNVPFTEHFKTHIRAMTNAPVKFGNEKQESNRLAGTHYDSMSIAFSHNLFFVTLSIGLIPKEHWSYPSFINKTQAALNREDMENRNVPYGESESYRHMCRYVLHQTFANCVRLFLKHVIN